MWEVLALVRLRQDEGEVALGDVADEEDVEEAVVGLGLRAHHHAAAQVAAVADHRVDHLPARDSPSTVTRISPVCQPKKTESVAQ